MPHTCRLEARRTTLLAHYPIGQLFQACQPRTLPLVSILWLCPALPCSDLTRCVCPCM